MTRAFSAGPLSYGKAISGIHFFFSSSKQKELLKRIYLEASQPRTATLISLFRALFSKERTSWSKKQTKKPKKKTGKKKESSPSPQQYIKIKKRRILIKSASVLLLAASYTGHAARWTVIECWEKTAHEHNAYRNNENTLFVRHMEYVHEYTVLKGSKLICSIGLQKVLSGFASMGDVWDQLKRGKKKRGRQAGS